jgi:DNA-binding NarL/FixJ family response regulator
MSTATAHEPRERASAARHRVALVEDQREVRERWARLLKSFGDFECVCACPSGEEALRVIPPLQPQVVLMDIFLPRMSGIECTARLKALLPQTQILILTASDDETMVFPALEAGADGYLLKQARPEALHLALLEVLNGGVPMTSGIARQVAEYFRARARQRDEVVSLSAREKEVLALLSKGYSNKEIAEKLSLSVETIHGYLKHVYEKMHVRSRAEAVSKYITAVKV